MKNRVKRIFDNAEKKPDAIVIKNSKEPNIDNNFFYVTSLSQGLFEGSLAILFPDGNMDLIIPKLELTSASRSNANVKIYKNEKEFNKILKDSLKSIKNIGLNFNCISHKDFCKIKNNLTLSEFWDVSDAFEKSRIIKDENEIELMKEAARIADKVMKKIPDVIYEGMYEYNLAAEINYLMQKNGADKPAFNTISSFNKNSAEPHYTHGNTRLKKGDFILCDFGACFKKYNSDITRTFVFGKSDEKQREMHAVVLEAQNKGLEKIELNLEACKVHDAVEKYINNTKFKGCFIHSTGHSLGLSVHDGDVGLNSDCDVKLKENMIFTIEPGIYISKFGGVRIEDDILIKKGRIELLTKTNRELIEI
ncbi:MAG: aminopeptidase P family protein [Thermoplasmatales archaeon]|nr:MAG: aminopeptidase P family protein [Thermoplasmatales archaeon]